jgi:hypothetical protein
LALEQHKRCQRTHTEQQAEEKANKKSELQPSLGPAAQASLFWIFQFHKLHSIACEGKAQAKLLGPQAFMKVDEWTEDWRWAPFQGAVIKEK